MRSVISPYPILETGYNMLNRNLTVLSIALTAILLHACHKNDMPAKADRSYHESFDSLELAIAKGWVAINNSKPIGSSTWHQGVYEELANGSKLGFPAQTWFRLKTEYAYCDYTCAGGLATISCWLISPELQFKNGDTVRFWTRTVNPVLYPDRLQVRLNITNSSADVGSDPESVGAFQLLAMDINKDLNKADYPVSWKKYDWIVEGLNDGEVRGGRIAFRYYVQNGGPSPDSKNSDTIGLDEFTVSPVR